MSEMYKAVYYTPTEGNWKVSGIKADTKEIVLAEMKRWCADYLPEGRTYLISPESEVAYYCKTLNRLGVKS